MGPESPLYNLSSPFIRLKYLNMDNNEIYYIPKLKLLGTSTLQSTVTQNMQNRDRNFDHDRSGRTSRGVSELREDRKVVSLTTELDGSGRPSRSGDKSRVSEEGVGHMTMQEGSGRTVCSASTTLLSNHQDRQEKLHQSKSDSFLSSKQQQMSPKLEVTQPQSNRPPTPGSVSEHSIPIVLSPVAEQADSSPKETRTIRNSDGGMQENIEQLSPSRVMMLNQCGSNLVPFPCLQTLSLVNNLVSGV